MLTRQAARGTLASIAALGMSTHYCSEVSAAERTFQKTSGIWHATTNWSGNQIPTADDDVIILSGQTCTVETSEPPDPALCKTLTLGGTLTVKNAEELRLGLDGQTHSSVLTGTIDLTGEQGHNLGVLLIRGNHTITGDGGQIKMAAKGAIRSYNSSTSDELTIAGVGSAREDSLTITGGGKIGVKLHNHGYVVANIDGGGGQLAVEDFDVDGNSSGHWIAEAGGRMDFNGVDVTGDATWEVVDADCGVNNPCGGYFVIDPYSHVVASGDVILKLSRNNSTSWQEGDGPALEVHGSFCTTGNLIWESIDVSGTASNPMIYVAGNKTAKFGVSSCSPNP